MEVNNVQPPAKHKARIVIGKRNGSDQNSIIEAEYMIDGFQTEETIEQLVCSICADVFDEPVSTVCGHTFCTKCIARHIKTSTTATSSEIILNGLTTRDIMERIRGKQSNQPVQPQTLLSLIQQQQQHIPVGGNDIGCFNSVVSFSGTNATCPMCRRPIGIVKNTLIALIIDSLKVLCIDKKCQWKGSKTALIDHLRNGSGRQPTVVGCSELYLCDCLEVIKGPVKDEHIQAYCQETILVCECGEQVKRRDITSHIDDICTKEICVCIAKDYGCSWSGRKKSLETHVREQCLFRTATLMIEYYKKRCDELQSAVESLKSSSRYQRLINHPLWIYSGSEIAKMVGIDNRSPYPDGYGDRVRQIIRTEEDLSTLGFKTVIDYSEGVLLKKFSTTWRCDLFPDERSNGVKIDLNESMGILCITTTSKLSRIFLVPVSGGNTKVDLKKTKAQVSVTFKILDKKVVNPILFASRRWTFYQKQQPPQSSTNNNVPSQVPSISTANQNASSTESVVAPLTAVIDQFECNNGRVTSGQDERNSISVPYYVEITNGVIDTLVFGVSRTGEKKTAKLRNGAKGGQIAENDEPITGVSDEVGKDNSYGLTKGFQKRSQKTYTDEIQPPEIVNDNIFKIHNTFGCFLSKFGLGK